MPAPRCSNRHPARVSSTLTLAACGLLLASPGARAADPGPKDDRPQTLPAYLAPPRQDDVLELPPLGPATPSRTAQPAPAELSADDLVAEVLADNPALAQMTAAWRAAAARYPQVTSLDDPMFAATVGPDTFAPDDPGLRFAYRLELSQKYPWPGKLRLRGEGALAEASAAGDEVADMRLRLVESARVALYEYYLAVRQLEVNDWSLRLLGEFRKNAEALYRTGKRSQQDVLQAEVELGRERQRRLALERMRQVAVARLNTLLSRPPDRPLPPPPRVLAVGRELPDAAALRSAALARRPDLQALANRLRADEAALALACKDAYPDFEPFVMYDRFMGNTPDTRDLAAMVGVRLNLPVRPGRRRGAVAEAEARLAQRRAELARRVNEVAFEVQEADARVREAARAVVLYERTMLPAAEQNVKAAQADYVTGNVPFLNLIEAERALAGLRERYYEAAAAYHIRLAVLERVTGGPPAAAAQPAHP
jgi:outer membrane protein TolC